MATFTDIIKSQRSQGAGVMGSLSTALSRSAMQKMDPRNYLFNKDGAMVALFPSLKGYQYGSKPSSSKISGSGLSEGFSSGRVELITDKLDVIDINTKTIAKNSLVLPSMARDMFLVKQNIIKLVKLQGGNPQTKSGDWFSRQQAREQAYESKFGKTSTSPTAVGGGEKKEGGIFSFLTGILTGGFISKIIDGLLKGGLLTAMVMGIGKYFTDGDFRKSVNETVGKILNTVFGEGWHKNLLVGISLVTGAFVAFKYAIGALTAVVTSAVAKIASSAGLALLGGLKSVGKGVGAILGGLKSAVKGKGKVGAILGAAVIGKQIYNHFSSKKESENASNVVMSGDSGVGMDNTDQSTTQQSGTNWSNVGSKVIDVALSGASLIASLPKGALLKRIAQFALKAASKGWLSRILAKFIARKFSKMFAFKVASFLGGLAVPGAGWAWSALNVVMMAYDLYIIYNAIFGAGGILEELEKEDVAANGSAPKMAERTDSIYESNPNEYVNAKVSAEMSRNSSQSYMMPTPVSSQNSGPMMDTAMSGNALSDCALRGNCGPMMYTAKSGVLGGNVGIQSSGSNGGGVKITSEKQREGLALVNKLLDEENITDPNMRRHIISLAHVESSLDINRPGPLITDKRSRYLGEKARGLFQFMPGNAGEFGYTKSDVESDPLLASRLGLKFFLRNAKRYKGDLNKATAYHLGGQRGVDDYIKTGGTKVYDLTTKTKLIDYIGKTSEGSKVGSSLNGMSAQVASDQRQQSVTVVPVVNSQTPQATQQSAPPAQLMPAEVMDSDLMRELFRKRPIQYVG